MIKSTAVDEIGQFEKAAAITRSNSSVFLAVYCFRISSFGHFIATFSSPL